MPWGQSQYEQAKSLLADPGLGDAKRQALQARVTQYEDDRARGYNAAPADEGRAPQPAIDVPSAQAAPTPKPGPNGYWKPERPLGVRDFIPQDVGGNLAMWRDMPLEVYKRKVLEPQRQMAIAAGEKAMLELQRYGVNAFSPQDQVQRTMLIAQGKAAAAQSLDSVTEEDPGYKQFNEAQFQKAVQERAADPNAGPIQRLEQLDTSGLAGKVMYGHEKMKDYALAGARGAVDMATLGLGTGALDAATEAIAGREPVEVARGLREAHPIASGVGAGAMAVARPGLAGPGLMRGVFGLASPFGRYGAAAAAGAAGSAAEGLGRDLSAEGADALSDSPEALQERGRLSNIGPNTLARAGLGAVAGMAGQGVADLGGKVANVISERAIRGTGGRTPYETAEAAGYTFDPIRGIVAPDRAVSSVPLEQAATRETGMSWAERFADKAARPLAQNVDAMAVKETADMAKENLSYFSSVGSEVTPVTNLNRALESVTGELKKVNGPLVRRLKDFVYDIEPLLTPRDMGKAIERVSNEAEKAAAGSDTQAAEAFKRLQAGLMEDLNNLPKGNLPEGWPALRAQHDLRGKAVTADRQLTGVETPGSSLPNELATVNRRLMEQGKRSVSARQEAALDRYMPPELKREALMLRAANMVEDLGGAQTGPYPSRAGVLNWVGGKLVPRAYGAGRAVSKPIPDTYPVSDKLFAWVNSRMPRATMLTPGANLPKMVRELAEMQNRPKRWGDLTPEQQQLLLDTLGTSDQKEVLQEATP
jgi:hypothetical protein